MPVLKSFKRIFPIILVIAAFFAKSSFSQERIIHPTSRYSFSRSALGDTLDATSYKIVINEVNTTAKTIDAVTTVNLTSKIDDLDHVTLELLDLTVDEVKVNGIIVPGFVHNSPWLIIPLANPMNTGDEVEITVTYHGMPFHEGWGGFHFSGNYAFNLGVGFESDPHNLGKAWFPCIDDFQDRALYEVIVTLDDPKEAVCGGTRLSVVNNGNGTHTYHWKLNNDIPTYLASVAIGDYAEIDTTFPSMTGANIPIGIFVRPNDSIKVAGTFQTLIPVLHAYEFYFGPYRWERVGYVGTSLGAMEHTTNIAYPNSSITGTLSNEWLMAHELSHQYFGDLITCATAEDMWLNEGWAVFCESLYREYLYGAEAYHTNMRSKHKEVLHLAHIEDGGYRALYGIPSEYTYGTTVYQKGGIVTHTLRNYIGDELFIPAVQAYVDEFQFSHASSWDLRDFLGAITGTDLTDFFDAWVFAPGFPEFSIDSFNVLPNGNNFDVEVFARQKLKGTEVYANSNKIEVTFMNHEWQEETVLMEFSGAYGSQVFTIGFNPDIAMMDLYDKVADATIDADVVINATGTTDLSPSYAKVTTIAIPSGDSAFVRFTHRWVPPDPLKTPVPGLTLSDYRHWRVDGIFPEGFETKGSFYYSRYNYLDNTLMADPNDSLVILYRPDRAADWQSIDFVKTGSANVGYIDVPDLKIGEYTLAVWDDLFVGQKEFSENATQQIRIYPNPADDQVIIEFGDIMPDHIMIYGENGQFISEVDVKSRNNRTKLNTGHLKRGTYILKFSNSQNEIITTGKMVIN